QLHETTTGEPIGQPFRDQVFGWDEVVFNPDGRTVLLAQVHRRMEVGAPCFEFWDLTLQERIGPHFNCTQPFASSPDARVILTGDEARWPKPVEIWEPISLEGTVEQLVLWTQVVTRMELDANDKVRPLDEATWEQRRQLLQEKTASSRCSNHLMAAATDRLYWLRQEAQECERAKQWPAVIKHLGRVIAADPTWEDLNRRGRAYAQLGQYAPGAQDYMAASQLGGEDWAGNEQRWHEHALLLVASGDGAGYRKLCARLLQHVDTTKGYYRADAGAPTCVLAPKAVPD